jgi:polyisoprenoid-binding protein YceI
MRISTLAALLPLALSPAMAHAGDIDGATSKITVHVEKSGLFSAFAHNHIISAPLASGHLDLEKRAVELKFRSEQMRVLDQGISDSERSDIDHTMKSDKVLDPARFPEISFVSTSVESTGANRYLARGNLTLHGVTQAIELPVVFSEGRYSGNVKLKQTEFGITPVKIAGGTVRVKDVVAIEFEIVPAK